MQDAAYFKALSNPQLDWAINDIRETLLLVDKSNTAVERKYLDQMNYALMERRHREGKDCCPTCQRPL